MGYTGCSGESECQVCSSDRLACNSTPTTYVSSLPGGEDRLLHPWGGGCPHCVHPDQPSRRKDQDGGWKDAAASRGQQETRSWSLPRPQLCLRQEDVQMLKLTSPEL